MKTLLIALLASSTLATALPSMAQAHEYETYGYNQNGWANDDWNNGGNSYAEFNQEYQHIWQGIQHGLNDGSLSRQQAWRFSRELRSIQARAYWEQRQGGYNSGEAQAQLERLHERIHAIHDRGHERQGYYGAGQGYGYGQNYGGGYDDRRDNGPDEYNQRR